MKSVALYTFVLTALSLVSATFIVARDGLPMYAQCGGQSYQGSTVCAAPGVCVAQNTWFSQCLQATASSSVTAPPVTSAPSADPAPPPAQSSVGSAPSSTSSTSTATGSPGATSFLIGVNIAGMDFGITTDGSSGTFAVPPTSQFSHFASQGVNIFRLPFGWQYMQPTIGGDLSSSFLQQYDALVQAALSQLNKPYVILDLHNYARLNGAIVGQGGPTNAQFADFWSKLAAKYANQPNVMFGVMNEPHDVDVTEWVQSVQAAVTAIRAAGATSQYILMPGSTWSHASALPTEAGPALAKVTDSAGGTDKLIFDVHQYLDSDGSGTSTTCTTDNTAVMDTLYAWLQSVGNRKALLSETGGGNTASCETDVAAELSYLKSHSDLFMGFTVWSAGAFDSSYPLSVSPNGDTDSALWTAAVKPLLS